MKIILTIVSVILITLPLYGPTPTPAKGSNEQEAKAANHQNETAPNSKAAHTSTPIIPQTKTPNTEQKTAKNTNKDNGKTAIERWTSFFLGIIIFAQFIVFIIQTRWMKRTAETAKENMIVSQRAFVFIKKFEYIRNHSCPN